MTTYYNFEHSTKTKVVGSATGENDGNKLISLSQRCGSTGKYL